MGKTRATLKEVARRAGVHTSTASRALDAGSQHLITEKVIEKVRRAAAHLDYRRNHAASSLRTKRTRSIGIVIPDITNMLFPPIIRGIEDRLAAQGYVAMIGHTDGVLGRERAVIDAFQARGIDGLIIASAHLNEGAITRAVKQGTSIVTVNRRVKDGGVSSVTSDDADGIAAVVEHLVGLGHRKIAYISGPEQLSTSHARLAAFKKWSKKAGLIGSDAQVITAAAFQEAEGERCAAALLDSRGKFTAIACANDLLAIGAISALDKRGLSCPLHTTVTGFNDIPFVDRISPSLTTVRVQQYQMGWTSAGLLMDNIAKSQKQRKAVHVVLPVTLIVRASSGPPLRPTERPEQEDTGRPNDSISSSEAL